jgi:hypothetical protein
VHSFPQLRFQIPLAKKKRRVYLDAQIEPGSLKNLTAQLKEGAATARLLRLRFSARNILAASYPRRGEAAPVIGHFRSHFSFFCVRSL